MQCFDIFGGKCPLWLRAWFTVHQYVRRGCFMDFGAAVDKGAAVNELRVRKTYKQKKLTSYVCVYSAAMLT